MVEDLLTFKQGVDEVVSKCFNSSDLFLNVLKECFEAFVNIRQNKPAELVAKYLDLRLRSGNKVKSCRCLGAFVICAHDPAPCSLQPYNLIDAFCSFCAYFVL